MVGFTQARSNIAIATVTAAVVVGLVTAPPDPRATAAKTAVAQVQLQAVATQIAALASTDAVTSLGATATTSGSSATTEASSEANDPLAPLRSLVSLVLSPFALAITPLWLLSAPITVPWFLSATGFNGLGAEIGLFFFPFAPVLLVDRIANALFPKPVQTSTPAAASAQPLAANAAREVTPPHPSASAQNDAPLSAIPAAADTTEENPFETPLGQVLIALNFLVLPLWFLAAPITLPLSMLAAASQLPDTDSPLNSLLFLAGTGIAFLTGPLGALSILLQPDPTPAAAVRASAASSMNTDTETNEDVAPDVAQSATEKGLDIRRTASASTPVRGRVTGLPANERPKSAAALRVEADQANDAKADQSAEAITSEGTQVAEPPAAKDGRGSAKANTGGRNR